MIKRKLKQALDDLIAIYGAETVKNTLDDCEPFATWHRESAKSSKAMWRNRDTNRYLTVRTREKLLTYVDIDLSIYDQVHEGRFIVWTHQKAEDGREVRYIEPRSKLDDFVAWLKASGFEETDDDFYPLPHINEYRHVQRDQEQRLRTEAWKADGGYTLPVWGRECPVVLDV